MHGKEPLNLTYLVKLWQVQSGGKKVWRGSLEDAHTGEKKGFGDALGLFAFLQEKIGLGLSQSRGDGSSLSDGSK